MAETILLVENEYALRELMRRFLEGSGYAVLNARDGDEALSVATAHPTPIDLLLTDVVMPGGTGRDLARRMAEIKPDLRVLYISGYPDPEYGGSSPSGSVLEPGVPFLAKPFSRDVLIQKINDMLA